MEAKKYDGKVFVHWEVEDGDPDLVENVDMKTTFVTMPFNGRL